MGENTSTPTFEAPPQWRSCWRLRRRIMCVIAGILIATAASQHATMAAYSSVATSAGNSFTAADSFDPACTSTSPSLLWFTGVENGAISTPLQFNSTVAVTADGTVARAGNYSLRAAKSSGSSSYIVKNVGLTRPVLSFAVRFATLPSADVDTVFKLDMATTADFVVGYQASTSRLTMRWDGISSAVSSTAVTAATWIGIDLRVDTSANPNRVDWTVAGVDQGSLSAAQAAASVQSMRFGSATTTDAFTAHFDDLIMSTAPSDYPLNAPRILASRPDGMGASVNPHHFDRGDGTPIDADSWTYLDDPDTFFGTDVLRQVTASTTSYLEVTFADTTATCIDGVTAIFDMGKQGTQTNHMRTSVFDGGAERLIHDGDSGCGNCTSERMILLPAGWTPAKLNGLIARFGYSTDVSPVPVWQAIVLEYVIRD